MQQLGIVPRLRASLLSGEKRSTIRFGEPDLQPGRLAYFCESFILLTRVTSTVATSVPSRSQK